MQRLKEKVVCLSKVYIYTLVFMEFVQLADSGTTLGVMFEVNTAGWLHAAAWSPGFN